MNKSVHPERCANCHNNKTKRWIRTPFDTFACSPECEQDLSDMLDGVSLDEIKARGRMKQ